VHIFPGNALGDMAMCPECGASGCGDVIWDVVAVGWFFIFPQHKNNCPVQAPGWVWQCVQVPGIRDVLGVAMLLMLVATGSFFILFFPWHSKITINLYISFSAELGKAQPRTWMLSLLQVVFYLCWALPSVVTNRFLFIYFIFPQHKK